MMSTSNLFHLQREGTTLLIVPLGTGSNLASGVIQPVLNDLLDQVQSGDPRGVIFDMEEISYFGSEMLAAMQTIWKRVRATGGKMVLCNVGDLGREILEIARFDTIWPIYPNREEALAAVAVA